MESNAASLSIPHPNREQALKRARLTAGFPNIVNGQRIDSSMRIKISDPVTGEELASRHSGVTVTSYKPTSQYLPANRTDSGSISFAAGRVNNISARLR